MPVAIRMKENSEDRFPCFYSLDGEIDVDEHVRLGFSLFLLLFLFPLLGPNKFEIKREVH